LVWTAKGLGGFSDHSPDRLFQWRRP